MGYLLFAKRGAPIELASLPAQPALLVLFATLACALQGGVTEPLNRTRVSLERMTAGGSGQFTPC